MAQNSTISISYKIDGDVGGLKRLSVSAEEFKNLMQASVVEAENLKKSCINFAAIATSIDSVSSALSGLKSVLSDLGGAYAAQIEAETKLATNMRNTMDAREADIQSIKDLCSAQQELGVIGDEVQLAGAQELATYLSEKQSLEQLIPVMNDMLAQQYGLNASQENAAQIATMLGKVMDGQTGALSRYGYKFDEAQEKILKYGTESQRAAVLTEVITASVGGMNAELAKTDVGKQKQLENTLGDIKEKFGQLAQKVLPFVTGLASTGQAVGGIYKIGMAISAVTAQTKSGIKALGDFWRSTAVITSQTKGLTKSIGTARLFISQFGTAVMQGTKGLKLFATAWRGMLISTGVGAAIAALASIIAYLCLKTDEATESTKRLQEAEARQRRETELKEQLSQQEAATRKNTIALLELNISKIKDFKGTKEEEKKIVEELNGTYGEAMGYFSSVSEWYKALITNSKAYCEQMVIEARTRKFADQIAEHQNNIDEIDYDEYGNPKKYSTAPKIEKKSVPVTTYTGEIIWKDSYDVLPSDFQEAQSRKNQELKKIAALKKRIESDAKQLDNIVMPVKGSPTPPAVPTGGGKSTRSTTQKSNDPVWTENPETLRQYEDNIRILDNRLKDVAKDEAVVINQQRKLFEEGRDAIRNAGMEKQDAVNENAKTLAEITENIRVLDKQLQDADFDKAAEINKSRDAYQEMADAIRNAGKVVEDTSPKFTGNADNLNAINDNISVLNKELQETSDLERAADLNRQIKMWQEKADAISSAGLETRDLGDSLKELYQTSRGLEGGVRSITDALGENMSAWERVTGLVDGFITIFEGIKKVVDLMHTLTTVTQAFTVAKQSETAATEAGTLATSLDTSTTAINTGVTAANTATSATNTAVKSGEAVAGATASGAKLPFPMNLVAIAAGIAAVIGALACVGKFATGGIVGGNSPSGDRLFARVNSGEMILNMSQQRRLFNFLNGCGSIRGVSAPELMRINPVIADLKPYLLGNGSGLNGATVRFEIDGRKLVGVLANETRIASKSGKRTNIKL